MPKKNFSHEVRQAVKYAKGFTLIEILIALTILAMGIIAAMAYLPVALDASKKAADLTKAATAASMIIEEIKAATKDSISAADSYDTAGAFTDFSEDEYKNFKYNVEISNAGSARTKDITVTIRWTSKGKQEQEIFKTKIFKFEPG